MSALERIGGRERLLDLLADAYVRGRTDLDVTVGDSPSHLHLLLVDGDGAIVAELRGLPLARSSAVRDDQSRELAEDAADLGPIVDEILETLAKVDRESDPAP